MSIQRLLAVLAVVITASGADAAPLRYDILDYFDPVRPDLTPGNPLDKGFSVSGTITAKALGFFGQGFASAAFQSWDITEQVGSPGQIDFINRFTTGNSSFELSGDPNVFRAVVEIDENFIWLLEDKPPALGQQDYSNQLGLLNPTINQQLTWNNPPFGSRVPKVWVSSKISQPFLLNGVYEETGSGRWAIARRNLTPVPLPAPGLLLIGAVVALGAHRARRKSA